MPRGARPGRKLGRRPGWSGGGGQYLVAGAVGGDDRVPFLPGGDHDVQVT